MTWIVTVVLAIAGTAGSDREAPVLTADGVIARLIQHDESRQSTLNGYTSLRKYVLENQRHHKRAEMVVRVTCDKDGLKTFDPIDSTGWSSARKHVFPRLLEGETEASRPAARNDSRIGPNNYSFELIGTEWMSGRLTYVIAMKPKEAKKYLVQGTMWVDAEDFAMVQIEGKPAKSPSFWVKSTHFVHRYEKHGFFWFPASDQSTSDARFFGNTDLTIEYFDYSEGARSLP
jgi:hypothetical protein